MHATIAGSSLGPIDGHVHLSLNGQGSLSGWSRRRWVMRPFLAAAHDIGLRGGFGGRDFDERYLNRLVGWLEDSSLSAAVLLAYDWVRDSSGFPQKDLSDLYVSNEAVITVARRHPKVLPGVSIHPARPDAFDELEPTNLMQIRSERYGQSSRTARDRLSCIVERANAHARFHWLLPV